MFRPALLALLMASCLAAPAAAQDLKYATTTTVQFSGTLGGLIGMFTDADEGRVDSTYVKDHWIRTDQGDQSTIFDWGAGTMTSLDHADRTFFVIDFGQMVADLAGGAEVGPVEGADPPPDPELDVQGSFEAERTGLRMEIDGVETEQVFLTIEGETRAVDEETQDTVLIGTIVLFSEMWMAHEFEGYATILEAQSGARDYMVGTAQEQGAMAAAFQQDARLENAMDRMEDELSDLEGFALKTTTLFLLVPPDVDFDKNAAVGALGLDPSVDVGGMLADAAAEEAEEQVMATAENAARSALGRVGGLFGGGKKEEEEEEAEMEEVTPVPVQVVLMRSVEEISGLESLLLDEGLFFPPAQYTEVTSPTARNP